MFDEFRHEQQFRQAWESVRIARPVRYTLFTFGASDLEYFLVIGPRGPGQLVSVSSGKVEITRPTIITPDGDEPEFRNFFDDGDDRQAAAYLVSRTAAFSNLRFTNARGGRELVSDSLDEAVSRLSRQLDDQDEDRIAILTAPHGLGGLAVMKYALDRVIESTPGNLQELRERGLLD